MCFSHLGVFLISVKPLTTENTENKTAPKICKITVCVRSQFILSREGGEGFLPRWKMLRLNQLAKSPFSITINIHRLPLTCRKLVLISQCWHSHIYTAGTWPWLGGCSETLAPPHTSRAWPEERRSCDVRGASKHSSASWSQCSEHYDYCSQWSLKQCSQPGVLEPQWKRKLIKTSPTQKTHQTDKWYWLRYTKTMAIGKEAEVVQYTHCCSFTARPGCCVVLSEKSMSLPSSFTFCTATHSYTAEPSWE